MNIPNKVAKQWKDPLRIFRIYEIMIAMLCIAIPVILKSFDKDEVYPLKVNFLSSGIIEDSAKSVIKDPFTKSTRDTIQLIDKDRLGFRTSISDYAYSTNSYLFGMLLCIAAMLFIFNSAVYFKSQDILQVNKKGKWYNVILGISLLGVICCPHRDWKNLHYLFAAFFFLGNAIVIAVFHNKADKKKSMAMAILAAGSLLLPLFKIKGFTLFWGEWVSLTVIGIHFILEAVAVNRGDLLSKQSNPD